MFSKPGYLSIMYNVSILKICAVSYEKDLTLQVKGLTDFLQFVQELISAARHNRLLVCTCYVIQKKAPLVVQRVYDRYPPSPPCC